VVDVDVGQRVRRKQFSNVLSAAYEYGFGRLQGRQTELRPLTIRNPYYFRKVRDSMRRLTRDQAFAFTVQTQSFWDASTPGVPHFVYTDHTHLANLRYRAFDPRSMMSEKWIELEREIYRNARLVFVTSRFAERSLVEDYGCPPERVKCIYSGVNIDIEALSVREATSRKNVLFVGREWERKGGSQLLRAFAIVREAHPDAELTIVGCRPSIDLENCTVVGSVPRETISSYYGQAAVFCLPSVVEPSAVALIEASGHGLPVVSTDVGGTSDRVLHGRTGYLVPPGNVERLASALTELLGSADKRKELGAAGRAYVLENFVWSKVGAKMARSIRKLGTQPSPFPGVSSDARLQASAITGNA
jgi:glycosyltransferase involved in cell wall biosynthesis